MNKRIEAEMGRLIEAIEDTEPVLRSKLLSLVLNVSDAIEDTRAEINKRIDTMLETIDKMRETKR